MPYTKPTHFTAWSNSRLGTYLQCPLKAKLGAIDKIQEPKSPAMQRGNDIHKLAEDFLKGVIPKVAPELKAHEALLKRLKAKRKKTPELVTVEDNWAFKKDWTETQWNDWNECWLRVKLDCAEQTDNFIDIYDWKTGKFSDFNKDDYLVQLELYAVGALILYGENIPDVVVRPKLVYTDAGNIYPGPEAGLQYTMADLPRLKKEWEKRVKPMMNDRTFAPKPNRFCSYCFYRKANKAAGGGQCKY